MDLEHVLLNFDRVVETVKGRVTIESSRGTRLCAVTLAFRENTLHRSKFSNKNGIEPMKTHLDEATPCGEVLETKRNGGIKP